MFFHKVGKSNALHKILLNKDNFYPFLFRNWICGAVLQTLLINVCLIFETEPIRAPSQCLLSVPVDFFFPDFSVVT